MPFLIVRPMRTARFIILLLAVALLAGCEASLDDTRKLSREEAAKKRKEDSLALKIGVLPTLDCLPLYIASEYGLFDSLKTDIRLKPFKSRIDSDAAFSAGKTEGCVTDIVSGQRMKTQGLELEYATSTNAYWQLISNRKSRLKSLKQLNDKMVAMTRLSATALLADYATDSAKLKSDNVFRIQVNDVTIRLRMLLNNEIDAVLLTEPHASTARLYKNNVLMDSRDINARLGAIAFNSKAMKDPHRQQQLTAFIKGYNAACDSINKNGVKHYADIVEKYCKTDAKTTAALPKMRFEHATPPRQEDIDRADKWLKNEN